MRIQSLAIALLGASLLSSCTSESTTTVKSGPQAMAKLEAKSGSTVSGTANFQATKGGVLVTIDVSGATAGLHAVHIHEKGDCSSEDGKSAGGHFNPGAKDHGSPHAAMHHAGDLGNMLVNEDGSGHHAIFMPELSIDAGDHSVIGRGIIMHASFDDLTSQPTGAAGGRIACARSRPAAEFD